MEDDKKNDFDSQVNITEEGPPKINKGLTESEEVPSAASAAAAAVSAAPAAAAEDGIPSVSSVGCGPEGAPSGTSEACEGASMGSPLGGPLGGAPLGPPMLVPAYPLMTCYKCFQVDFPYFGIVSGRIESWVVAAMRQQLLHYHRRAVRCIDRW